MELEKFIDDVRHRYDTPNLGMRNTGPTQRGQLFFHHPDTMCIGGQKFFNHSHQRRVFIDVIIGISLVKYWRTYLSPPRDSPISNSIIEIKDKTG